MQQPHEYDDWFAHADADGDGRVSGAEAVHFFMRAGLPKTDLAKLWDAADHEREGSLDRRAFSLACALIGALQQYGTITRDVFDRALAGDTRGFPKPKMQGLELPAAPTATTSQPPVAAATGGTFGNVAPSPTMEFTSPTKDDLFAISSGVDDFAPVAPAPVERAPAPVAPTSLAFDAPPRATSVEHTVQAYQAPAVAVPVAPEASVDWPVIGPNDWQRYQQIFLLNTNGNPEGRLSGQQVAPILLGMNAPKQVLKDVWELSDSDKDGSLVWTEFVVAAYLTEQARNGLMPPKSLPPGQFPPFSMTAGAQPAPVAPVVPEAAPTSVLQVNAVTTDGLMTPSIAREQLQNITAPAQAAPQVNEAYTYRGPMANIDAIPEQDRDLAEKVKENAEKSDRELWEQEMNERQNVLSAHAAQEVLANLGLFVRKCEAGMTEASYRAQVAESQVIELRQKCEVMEGRVTQLVEQLAGPIERIEASKKEHEELSARYQQLEERHAELSQNASQQNHSQMMQDNVSLRAKVEAKSAQIVMEETRASQAATTSLSAQMRETQLTATQPPATAALMDFGGVSAASTNISPASANAKSTFEEWDNWGTTAREEASTQTRASSMPAQRHRKVPSEIPAVTAALIEGDGGFFDSIDSDPFGQSNESTSPAPAIPPSSFGDDPFGAPPPTPPGDYDDPFGAPPSPGPTPPQSARASFIDIDPFAM